MRFAGGWNPRQSQQVAGMKSDQWREEGPWLLLPLMLLVALAFRRGYLVMLCLAVLLPMPHSAYAMEWNDLWQRPDQRGAQALAAQQPQQAATLFKDPQWRAAAHYRAGDYQAALNDLEKQDGAAAAYNRGNALAHLGKLPEALSAYEDALKRDPDFKDAAYNRDLVKKWLQSQQNSSSDKGQQGKNQSSQQNGKEQQQQGRQQSGTKGSQQPQQGQQLSEQQGQDQSQARENAQSAGNKNKTTLQKQGDRSGKNLDNATAKDEQALRQDQRSDQNKQIASDAAQSDEAASPQNESDQATEQWLRRIPDDPGGLWRRKFLYQYKKNYKSQQGEAKPW